MKIGKTKMWSRLLNRNFLWFNISDALYWGGSGVINTFLGVLVATQISDGSLTAVGLTIFAFQFSNAVSGVPLSFVTNKLSFSLKRGLVGYTMMIYGILMVMLGYATVMAQVIILQIIFGLIEAFTYPIRYAIFSMVMDKGYRVSSWSVENTLTGLAAAGVAFAAGLLSERFDLKIVFWLFGLLVFSSGIMFLFISEKVKWYQKGWLKLLEWLK